MVDNEDDASSYYRLRRQIESLSRKMNRIILSPKYCLPFVNPGRLVKVRHGKNDFGWGIIMSFKKVRNLYLNYFLKNPLGEKRS